MMVVGPGGSGETRLVFSMLASQTFHSGFSKVFYCYKEYQPLFSEIEKDLYVEFVPCLDFDMIKYLEDCLLIFDNSGDKIYQEKEFVRLAFAKKSQQSSLHFR